MTTPTPPKQHDGPNADTDTTADNHQEAELDIHLLRCFATPEEADAYMRSFPPLDPNFHPEFWQP